MAIKGLNYLIIGLLFIFFSSIAGYAVDEEVNYEKEGREAFLQNECLKAVDLLEKAASGYQAQFLRSKKFDLYQKVEKILDLKIECYRWKIRDYEKTSLEYERLLSLPEELEEKELIKVNLNRMFLAQVYEKNLERYNMAAMNYKLLADAAEEAKAQSDDKEVILYLSWIGDWAKYSMDRVNIDLMKKAGYQRTLRQITVPNTPFEIAWYFIMGGLVGRISNRYQAMEIEDFPKMVNRFVVDHPYSYEALLLSLALMKQLEKNGDISGTIQLAERLIAMYPEDYNTFMLKYKLYQLYKITKENAKAELTLKELREKARNNGIQLIEPNPQLAQLTDKEAIDIYLREMWEKMRKALERGDIEDALQYFSTGVRDRYREIFRALRPKLYEVSQGLKDIRLVEIRDDAAEYEILRVEEGRTLSYYLLFVKEPDGRWKIGNM